MSDAPARDTPHDTLGLTLDQVHALALDLLRANGFDDAHAQAIARTVTAAERDECRHHGLFRIPFYIAAVRSGQASGTAVPTLSDAAPAVLRVDAHGGFAPLALELAEAPLAERAHRQGIAALAINNAHNVGPLWPEVERLASRGLVALAFTAASPYVAPHGGTQPLFGTNPMAFGWPRDGRLPLVFDQASSASARGEIQLRLREGLPLPEGWAIGPDGEPTTDPAQALAGAQLPFGGAKGSSIALMIELLAGPLLGDMLSFEAGARDVAGTGAPCGGELLIAMDPARFLPGLAALDTVAHDTAAGKARAAQLAHAEQLFERILAQPGTRLPSQRRYEARARSLAEGVRVPRALHDELVALAPSPAGGRGQG